MATNLPLMQRALRALNLEIQEALLLGKDGDDDAEALREARGVLEDYMARNKANDITFPAEPDPIVTTEMLESKDTEPPPILDASPGLGGEPGSAPLEGRAESVTEEPSSKPS